MSSICTGYRPENTGLGLIIDGRFRIEIPDGFNPATLEQLIDQESREILSSFLLHKRIFSGFADRPSKVTISNNNLRITLVQNGPDNTRTEPGTLIIPINQAAPFINALGNSLIELNEQLARQGLLTGHFR